ncbi:Hypothetical predicted protein [Olea europaea subsp. europaea]|uniref:Uncharacterized protein n=1 Tax=Olea europaea subsp. europaea TaxID=158383 RepID=A0A8S0VKG6_OLEEU|nr:Hypothetical predicted protein [Olea europaea subsp. europaea]
MGQIQLQQHSSLSSATAATSSLTVTEASPSCNDLWWSSMRRDVRDRESTNTRPRPRQRHHHSRSVTAASLSSSSGEVAVVIDDELRERQIDS